MGGERRQAGGERRRRWQCTLQALELRFNLTAAPQSPPEREARGGAGGTVRAAGVQA